MLLPVANKINQLWRQSTTLFVLWRDWESRASEADCANPAASKTSRGPRVHRRGASWASRPNCIRPRRRWDLDTIPRADQIGLQGSDGLLSPETASSDCTRHKRRSSGGHL